MIARALLPGMLLAALGAPLTCAAGDDLFRQQVAPLLERHCVSCHQGDKPKGGLSLVSEKQALAGGESGAILTPGKPDESLILEQISGEKPAMPKGGRPLTSEQVALVRRWISEGARWPSDITLRDKKLAGAEEDWWSLQPLARPGVPAATSDWVRTPVDAFILAKLKTLSLAPSREAQRRTLIRRVTYDLHGLPPTPEEITAFLDDPADDAYDRLIDRLLASPRYGERWGRHWLDIVHFGESHGYDKDKPRPNAWPYRDYVIAAFNNDTPYQRFVEEQLAGDVLFPDDPRGIVATGFIAAGPWDFVGHAELREGTLDKKITRSNDRDDMVATAMSTFVSLTVHCARCHNHKFDPIAQEDYYRLQAVFAGIDRADRDFDSDPSIHQLRRKLVLARAPLAARQKLLSEKQKDASGPDSRENDRPLTDLDREIAEFDRQLAALPAPRKVYAAASRFEPIGSFAPAASPRPVYLLHRGSDKTPGPEVTPGTLACVAGLPADFPIEEAERESESGEGARRAALARWITDPRNPLTRRSIVNRIWQYHFGRGLVDTPNDFGHMGSRPTHPELLDWLAVELAEPTIDPFSSSQAAPAPWSLKRLHRLILTSAVYRQSSGNEPDMAAIDSANQYLWRQNRQRLEAEAIRDAALAVSGDLDPRMGGPSDRQFFFKDDHSPIYDYERFDVGSPEANRRSVYRFIVRSVPDPFLECLDAADPSLLTPKRNTTLTALQALSLLNNQFMIRQAGQFAHRLQGLSENPARQIAAAYQLALGRDPRPAEVETLVDYARRHGLANACRVILNSNEFLFID